MSYHRFGHGVETYGSFEVFYHDDAGITDARCEPFAPGYYCHSCFPGCMPDSDANGPFATEEDAINDARSGG